MDHFLMRLPNGLGKRKVHSSTTACGSSKKTDKSKGMQMFIDYGQKSFGKTKTCPKCCMLLVMSDPDDIKRHDKFCGEVSRGQSLPTLDGHKVVSLFDSGLESVIEVTSNQSLHQRNIRSVLDGVEKELGSSCNFDDETEKTIYLYVRDKVVIGCLVVDQVNEDRLVSLGSWEATSCTMSPATSHITQASAKQQINSTHHKKEKVATNTSSRAAYQQCTKFTDTKENNNPHVLISGRSAASKTATESPTAVVQISAAAAAAAVISEGCSSTVTTSDSDLTSPKTATSVDVGESSNTNTSSSSSSSSCRSTLGVRLIWVAESSRRQGVATRLVDTARACFAYGEIIERRKVAFTQPTREGFVFASNFCGSAHVLSYC